jgi:putative methyltransferase (TIGR04325 family)
VSGKGKPAKKFSGVVWEGVYAGFDEVPAVGDGFSGERWTRAVSGAAAQPAYPSLLAILLAVAETGTGPIRVLDFGGGTGSGYRHAKESVPGLKVDYHVVEMPNVCEAGRPMFAGDQAIHFHSEMPIVSELDVAHFGSSIQYVRDWQGLLKQVARLNPKYILFSDLAAGENPTYASAQTYYDSRIPVWFFNFADFSGFLGSLGFGLRFRVRADTSYFGEKRECPQENFPPEYRLGYPSHALFARK